MNFLGRTLCVFSRALTGPNTPIRNICRTVLPVASKNLCNPGLTSSKNLCNPGLVSSRVISQHITARTLITTSQSGNGFTTAGSSSLLKKLTNSSHVSGGYVAPVAESGSPRCCVSQVRMSSKKPYIPYRPNARKRKRKQGMRARTSTRAGLELLWRRKIKGRHTLTV